MTEEIPNLDLPDPEATAEALRQALGKMPRPLFAVLDGGLFDDLPGDLTRKNIACRSLFLDHADKDIELAGPWLVALVDDDTLNHVADLALAKPCAVFWSCPGGDMALWRHLRTINEILIPAETASGEGIGERPSGEFRRVLFRHWDPNVFASVLPLLSGAQFARVFGPAEVILMNAPDYGGLKRATKRTDWPEPARGLLRIESDQIGRLQEVMVHSSRLRIARYLKENIPPNPPGISDETAWRATLANEKTSHQLGIQTEAGKARWAYLNIVSDNKATEIPEIRRYIQNGEESPDEQVRSLMRHTIDALRTYGKGVPA
ncbi:DUF4123 domain-containing protein [Labrys neptuniae]|uniref:DUF4123 domain-containing protein n=1 Tax=Labrys neptuniae TaxID=376174 RepID=A0ABV3PY93_9HYPH